MDYYGQIVYGLCNPTADSWITNSSIHWNSSEKILEEKFETIQEVFQNFYIDAVEALDLMLSRAVGTFSYIGDSYHLEWLKDYRRHLCKYAELVGFEI